MAKPILVFTSTLFGGVAFIVAFALGTALTAGTGIPLLGGLANGVLTGMVLAAGLLSAPYPGSATVMWLAFSVCAAPTTTLGPPGLYKLGIGFVAGLLWDLVFQSSRRARWGMYLGGLLGSASIMLTLVAALSYGLGRSAEQALENYRSAFYFILAINLVVTLVGLYLGDVVYRQRLSKLSAFRNLSRHVS